MPERESKIKKEERNPTYYSEDGTITLSGILVRYFEKMEERGMFVTARGILKDPIKRGILKESYVEAVEEGSLDYDKVNWKILDGEEIAKAQ